MDKHIKQILADLYAYDDSLRQREPELTAIIKEILLSKPDTKFDEVFALQLRSRLANRIRYEDPKLSPINSFKATMKKLNFSLGIVAVLAILVVSTLYVNNKSGNRLSVFTPGVKITHAGEGAFGELANVGAAGRGQGGGGGLGGGAGGSSATSDSTKSSESASPAGIGGGGGDAKMAPYIPTNYKYVYKGEPLVLTETKLDVLKRLKVSSDGMQGLIDSLNFGLINLGSFGNSKLQNASFVQDGQNGYYINVDVLNGSISLNGAWPQMAADTCGTESGSAASSCMPAPFVPVKLSDIPADEELIAAANQFVSDHNISLAAYGAPEVSDEYRTLYERALKQKVEFYLPEVVNVIYPLRVSDETVFDEAGNKVGLNIGIHVRNKKVVSMWELSVQNYQASTYEAETDISRIMKLLERGDAYGWVDPSAIKTVEVEVGAPKLELVRMWDYQNNESFELLVPSLVWPVLNQPENEPYFYRKAVVVPLVKKILDRRDNTGGGPVKILPMEESK